MWLPFDHSNRASYCDAEFGISRAQAYRLLDVARALAAIHDAVTASTDPSRTRDTDSAALDYGLPQRALITMTLVRYPVSVQAFLTCGFEVALRDSSWMPPTLSETLAAVPQTARSRPRVSTPR